MNLSNRGSSIIQVLVLTGIISMILLASMVTVENNRKEQRNMTNKIEFKSVQALAKDIMGRESECNCQIAGKTFDSDSAAATFSLTSFKSSCAPGATDLITTTGNNLNQISAESLIVNNIKSTVNSNEYTGDLLVGSPDLSNKGIRKLKSEPISFLFYTDPASTNANKLVKGCGHVPLSIPANLNSTTGPGSGTCTFNWTESAGLKPITYTVRGGSTAAGNSATGARLCQVSNMTTCQISGLANNVAQYFAIEASNIIQGSSGYSAEITCKPAVPATVPVISKTSAVKTCNLSWAASSGSSPITYTVYQSTVSPVTTASTIVCNKISAVACSSTGLNTGTTYYYAAVANNPAGSTALSNQVSCTP